MDHHCIGSNRNTVFQLTQTLHVFVFLLQAAITTLKALVAAFEWDEARDLLVDLCYELTNRTDDSIQADVLCPGVIDLQGPHVRIQGYILVEHFEFK